MNRDIAPILQEWPFDPDSVNARVIEGADGSERIQLRVDLGLLQMERDGRPDGLRVNGYESWLELHEAQLAKHDTANPDGKPYQLEPEDCAELIREAVQYYHRYVSFWQLKKYELCARDTDRNLRLIVFVSQHARKDRDRAQVEQWRPYVIMMHARAVATPLLDLNQHEAARGVVDAGIDKIEDFLAGYGRSEEADRVGELRYLKRWRKEIDEGVGQDRGYKPAGAEASPDPAAELRAALNAAIDQENYEEAARLRDELKRLGETSASEGGAEA
ncbi:MAG: UvrB/UvrC motif-containing protein [Planctomycetota bacterium]